MSDVVCFGWLFTMIYCFVNIYILYIYPSYYMILYIFVTRVILPLYFPPPLATLKESSNSFTQSMF